MTTWQPPRNFANRPVVVLGAGVLGRRIAAVWANAGYSVHIRDPSAEQAAAASSYVSATRDEYIQQTGVSRSLGKVSTFQELSAAVENAWLVFESVPENLTIKIDTMADLIKHAPSDAIIGSNSSSYRSGEMLEKVASDEDKARILNTHYMMPPGSRVVELMTDGFTDSSLIDFLADRFRDAGMHPYVAVKQSSGFIFNRVWAAIKRECLNVLAEGVTDPATLDDIWKEMYNTAVGPCAMMDHVGLDTVAFIEKHYAAERGLPSENTVGWLEKNYLSAGKLGMKSGKGGLFPPAAAAKKSESATRVLVLDTGLGQPVEGKSLSEALSQGQILEVTAEGRSVHPLIKDPEAVKMPDGIVYSKKQDRLYWTNMGNPSTDSGSVYSSKPDGTDVKRVLAPGTVFTPKQLSIDDENARLYISDREGMKLISCAVDGSAVKVLARTGDLSDPQQAHDQNRWCVGSAFSPGLRRLFWTQKGPSKASQGRIWTAPVDSDGNLGESTCLLSHLPEPIDLEFDEATGDLYWTDRGELPFGNSLNRIKLDAKGSSVIGKPGGGGGGGGGGPYMHTVLAGNFHETIGLNMDRTSQTWYVADLAGTLWKCGVNGERKVKVYENDQMSFTGVAVVSP